MATRQRRNSYTVDFQIRGQRVRQGGFESHDEATAWEVLAKLAIKQGKPLPPTGNHASVYRLGPFLKEALPVLYGGTKNEDKACRLARQHETFFGPSIPLADINANAIAEMVQTLKKQGNGNGTINRKVAVLSRVLKYAQERGLITVVPHLPRLRESEGRTRFLSGDEETHLMGLLERWGQTHFRMFAQFLLYTGCRVSEATKLEWRDVDDRKVTFWDTKNGKSRSIPITEPVREALAWCQSQGWKTPFSGIKYNTFIKMWDRVKYTMGLEDDIQFVPHALRHTCASRMVQNGVDIRRVQVWMGHSSVQVTMRYAHLAPDDLESAAAALTSPTNSGMSLASVR